MPDHQIVKNFKPKNKEIKCFYKGNDMNNINITV